MQIADTKIKKDYRLTYSLDGFIQFNGEAGRGTTPRAGYLLQWRHRPGIYTAGGMSGASTPKAA